MLNPAFLIALQLINFMGCDIPQVKYIPSLCDFLAFEILLFSSKSVFVI